MMFSEIRLNQSNLSYATGCSKSLANTFLLPADVKSNFTSQLPLSHAEQFLVKHDTLGKVLSFHA